MKKPKNDSGDRLLQRIEAKQAEVKERRANKQTSETIAERLAERRQVRSESAADRTGRLPKLVSVALGCALLAGVAVSVSITNAANADLEAQAAQIEQSIGEAKAALAATPVTNDDEAEQYADDLDAQLAEARAKGEEVAALQQQFAAIAHSGNGEQTSNGGITPALRAEVEHRRTLEEYFVERSLITEPAQAYAPGSTLPFASDEIDPRFPWLITYADGKDYEALPPEANTWQLASMMPAGTNGVFTATWLNRNTQNELLAWATASYYVDGTSFGGLAVGLTTTGERAAEPRKAGGE